jgi:hypothetical protein
MKGGRMYCELNYYPPAYNEPIKLEAIFRNSSGEVVVRWVDNDGEIRVIERCQPHCISFYEKRRKRGNKIIKINHSKGIRNYHRRSESN